MANLSRRGAISLASGWTNGHRCCASRRRVFAGAPSPLRPTRLNRREFLALTCGGAWVATLRSRAATPVAEAPARAFPLSAAGSGRATGYAEASKIVTVGDRTHVTWLDATPEGFRVRIRTLA